MQTLATAYDSYEGCSRADPTIGPMPTSRVEAFSDGVFAIAITLLIIDVRPPHSAPGELAGDLVSIWPSYAAYVVSFVIIGIIWVNHHDIFTPHPHSRCPG